jgi:hypothetical protein
MLLVLGLLAPAAKLLMKVIHRRDKEWADP